MHDIRAIRADPAAFDAAMARRGLAQVTEQLLSIDAERRGLLSEIQERQATRNALAKKIGEKRRAGEDTGIFEDMSLAVRGEIAEREARASELDAAIPSQLALLPNVLDPDVPDGADEAGNVVLHQSGTPRTANFPFAEHFALGEALGGMDFERAARMSGARFTLLRGPLARMERALGQFMLDLHTGEHGYTEMAVPLLVNDAAAYGTDKLKNSPTTCSAPPMAAG